jgi:hypothetical protein
LSFGAAGSKDPVVFVFGKEKAGYLSSSNHRDSDIPLLSLMENRVATEVLTDAEIVARCRSGALIEDMGRDDLDNTDPKSLLSRCVFLHNTRQIDLLTLAKTAQFASLSGSTFFDCQSFFYRAIPRLETTAPPLMDILVALRSMTISSITLKRGATSIVRKRSREASSSLFLLLG